MAVGNGEPKDFKLGDVIFVPHPEYDRPVPVVFLELWAELPGRCLCYSVDDQGEELLWVVAVDLVESAPLEVQIQLQSKLDLGRVVRQWQERREEVLKLAMEELGSGEEE